MLGTSASVPSVSRNLSSMGVRYEGEVYLFDCGEGTQRQMMKYKLSYAKTKAIFITHLHADHYLGIAGLCHTLHMIGRKDILTVYGPRGTVRRMEGLGCNYEFLRVEEVGEGVVYKGEGFSVRAFPVEHGRNALGYVLEEDERRNFEKEKCDRFGIKGVMFRELERKGEVEVEGRAVKIEEVTKPKKGKKIVYSGDTRACRRVEEEAKGADLLIHEGTFGEDRREEADEREHSTVADAAELARRAGAKRLIITHISNRYGKVDELLKEARKAFDKAEIAKDGMEIMLK